jgi:hypothetical protein
MDTTSSGKLKAPAKTQALAAGGLPDIPAKPRAIASEFFQVQQKLYLISDATTVSISPLLTFSHISPQSPKMPAVQVMGIRDFPTSSFNFSLCLY